MTTSGTSIPNTRGCLQIGPSNAPNSFNVIDAESYAVSPDQVRYGIETEPHPFDLREDKSPLVPYIRDRVYLVKADGKRLKRKWKNGRWQFHFALDGLTGRTGRDFTMDMGTFYYNPVVHGPPL